MYQNVYYEKEKNIIHCWDDEKGYYTSKYRRYAYVRDGNGAHQSIHGERLKKLTWWKTEDDLELYESDVIEVTRFAASDKEMARQYASMLAGEECVPVDATMH